MANICYTKYKVEAPAEQIEALTACLNSEWKQEAKEYAQGGHYGYLHYCRIHPLDSDAVADLAHGWKVLSFETATKWSPEHAAWVRIIGDAAPDANIIYYTEELWAGPCETNDVWGRYFPTSYVVALMDGSKLPQKIRNTFMEDAEHRDREDQVGWFSYLHPFELSHRLSDIGSFRGTMDAQIDQFYEKLNHGIRWKHEGDLVIRPIRRVENPLIRNVWSKSCQFCKKYDDLLTENSRLSKEIYRLQAYIRKYEHGKADILESEYDLWSEY